MTVTLTDLVGNRSTTFGYLGKTAATDEQVQDALTAERGDQANKCRRIDPAPAPLDQALKRRVARNLTMRGLPVGVLRGDAEAGSDTLLPGADPEIRRLEQPYRKLTIG